MIVLLSNYRVGSSTFIKELSAQTNKKYQLEFTGEYLHPEASARYRRPSEDIEIYKIMPDQIQPGFDDEFCLDYLDKAQEIIYLLRKNFTEQVLSHAVADLTGEWHPISISNTPRDISVDINEFKKNEIILLRNLESQSNFYKRYPGKIIYLEDRYDTEQKYKSKINVLNHDELKSTINVQEYF